MQQVTFVILHYLTFEVTVKCVESILSNIKYENYKIVIMDNGSVNGSGEKLECFYKNNNNVKVIISESNLGFSAGNNIGYKYAKKSFKADFIVVLNNDTEIVQKDFIAKLKEIYEETEYYVLGPDIVNLDGIHQSPQRNHIITLKEIRRWYYTRLLFSIYLHLHKFLRLPNNFIGLQIYRRRNAKRYQKYQYDKRQENVELQGACFIFSPKFVYDSEVAFEELTFMYGEEPLLGLRCLRNGWKMVYDPSIRIKHAERLSTKISSGNTIDTEIFYSDTHVKAIGKIMRSITTSF